MSRYLNSTRRNHHISHILAADGESALCVASIVMNKVWPRVSKDWQIGDEPTQYLCHNCRHRKEMLDAPLPPPRKTRKEKRMEAERAKLLKWNKQCE